MISYEVYCDNYHYFGSKYFILNIHFIKCFSARDRRQ